MYKIGELSKITKIPVKTLRFYDNEGILSPDKIDKYTGYRYYSASKIKDCYRILALKELGFTLEEIKIQFSISKNDLISKRSELSELKSKTEKRLANLHSLYSSLENNGDAFNVVIRKSDDMQVLYSRNVITDCKDIDALFSKLSELIPNEGLLHRKVIIDYNTEYDNGIFDIGVGIELHGEHKGFNTKKLSFGELSACLACSEESYQNALLFINKYIDENNYQIVGPVYKILYKDGTVEIKIPVFPLSHTELAPIRESVPSHFENDENAIGRWELIDTLACYEQFNIQKLKDRRGDKEIYFLPDGENFYQYTWTNGYLIYHNAGQITKNPYTIKEFDGAAFMLIEMRLFYGRYGGKPIIWVLKKISSKKYSANEIRIQDEIPVEFINDVNVIGKWKAFDIALKVDSYFSESERFLELDKLFWHSAEFLESGLLINEFKGQITKKLYTLDNFRWTNGCIMDINELVVSKYIIKQFKGEDYLFIEWKSGDYKFGGKVNCYYVFKRGE
ncbi:MAG: MerR family transcriptional regulator [Clostridia bacterium]|nr:MerR family transcriptional regulator [Clostridia bacterium]